MCTVQIVSYINTLSRAQSKLSCICMGKSHEKYIYTYIYMYYISMCVNSVLLLIILLEEYSFRKTYFPFAHLFIFIDYKI